MPADAQFEAALSCEFEASNERTLIGNSLVFLFPAHWGVDNIRKVKGLAAVWRAAWNDRSARSS